MCMSRQDNYFLFRKFYATFDSYIRNLVNHTFHTYLLIFLESSDDDGDDPSKAAFETKSASKISSLSLKSPILNIARSYDSYIDVFDDWIDIL